jgi:hypothetical protein
MCEKVGIGCWVASSSLRQAEERVHPAERACDRDDQPGRVSDVSAVPIALTPSP